MNTVNGFVVVMTLLFACANTDASVGDKDAECDGPFKGKELGKDFTDADLNLVLKLHRQWFDEIRKANINTENGRKRVNELENDERRANLCGAVLDQANLEGARLQRANFDGASLFQANLERTFLSSASFKQAFLSGVNLKRAILVGANFENAAFKDLSTTAIANLTGAILSDANLRHAQLWGANLERASLVRANLEHAILWKANLSRANLQDANLASADLSGANLEAVLFEPESDKIPNVVGFVDARNLWRMTFIKSPHSLIAIRQLFKESGWRRQEREITYAIKHSELMNDLDRNSRTPVSRDWSFDETTIASTLYDMELAPLYELGLDEETFNSDENSLTSTIDALFRLVLFDVTTQWGMNPGRALVILLNLIPFFSVPYIFALRVGGKDGIWQDWSDKRARRDLGQDDPLRLRVRWVRAIGLGLYFSVLSAFHIGWRDLNVGSWIARIQPHEYTLRATGWVRIVSGIQSLISVYLLAIWALTYFGRPFE